MAYDRKHSSSEIRHYVTALSDDDAALQARVYDFYVMSRYSTTTSSQAVAQITALCAYLLYILTNKLDGSVTTENFLVLSLLVEYKMTDIGYVLVQISVLL